MESKEFWEPRNAAEPRALRRFGAIIMVFDNAAAVKKVILLSSPDVCTAHRRVCVSQYSLDWLTWRSEAQGGRDRWTSPSLVREDRAHHVRPPTSSGCVEPRLSTMSSPAARTPGASTAGGGNDEGDSCAILDRHLTRALTPFEKVLADTARRREANAKRDNVLALKESSKLKVNLCRVVWTTSTLRRCQICRT